jgi:hypothetical protein
MAKTIFSPPQNHHNPRSFPPLCHSATLPLCHSSHHRARAPRLQTASSMRAAKLSPISLLVVLVNQVLLELRGRYPAINTNGSRQAHRDVRKPKTLAGSECCKHNTFSSPPVRVSRASVAVGRKPNATAEAIARDQRSATAQRKAAERAKAPSAAFVAVSGDRVCAFAFDSTGGSLFLVAALIRLMCRSQLPQRRRQLNARLTRKLMQFRQAADKP